MNDMKQFPLLRPSSIRRQHMKRSRPSNLQHLYRSSSGTSIWHYIKLSCQLHTSAALTPKSYLLVTSEEEAGWAPELVWTFWRREKRPFLTGIRSPDLLLYCNYCIVANVNIVLYWLYCNYCIVAM